MYTPSENKETDSVKLLAFMQANSFAVMCCSGVGGLKATHLPFVIEQRGEQTFITSHMARANDQWKDLGNGADLLLIFQGAHGYISPSLYEKKESVPTWNYIAVHAYGKARLLTDKEESIHVLEKMISQYEPAYFSQWKQLNASYIDGMIKGIVAFEIEVSRLEGKYKLSQNKTEKEKDNIIESLEASKDVQARALSEEMKLNRSEQAD
jgi:transcriptional regulator